GQAFCLGQISLCLLRVKPIDAVVGLVIFRPLCKLDRTPKTTQHKLLVPVFYCGMCFFQTVNLKQLTLVQIPEFIKLQPGLIKL
ncbi:hypothetical protein, partial [Enterobacter hormaechei]